MLTGDASWLVEEPVLDEPADLSTLPEIKQRIGHDPHDDELGLRALLEGHEGRPSPWWCGEPRRARRKLRGSRRLPAGLASAA